jgi:putative ABC transport system permease protein
MRLRRLIARNLAWHWRTNLAVIAGVAVTSAVLGGALLVGESVRASLRRLATERLGATEVVLSSANFFREDLARAFPAAAPLIVLEATVRDDRSGARAAVTLYGVDSAFYSFNRVQDAAPTGRTALLSPALARELSAQRGDPLLLRFDAAASVPRESLHGRREMPGRTLRVTVREGVVARSLPEFALRPQQGEVRAIFVPRALLARAIERPGEINTVLLAGAGDPAAILREKFELADLGLHLETLDAGRGLSLTHSSTLLPGAIAAKALPIAPAPAEFLAYLANEIRANGRQVPYSLVAALDARSLEALAHRPVPAGSIVLNDWAARDLGAKPGDRLDLDYFLWSSDGGLQTKTASFTLAAVVPIAGLAADRDIAPRYPGITDAETLGAWDPPFPIDLKKVRPADEDYWKRYRTTPKAWITLQDGQRLWGSRYGKLTSIRAQTPQDKFAAALRAGLDPLESGFSLTSVRAQASAASAGSTDFGEYFLYFSFFVLVSALLLTALFFRLGIEQRLNEIGVLRALGFGRAKERQIFLAEGAVLALAGAAVGSVLALAYAALILHGLRTWWVDAVGTRLITLSFDPPVLAGGALAGLLVALAAILWTLRGVRDVMARGLLAPAAAHPPKAWTRLLAWICLACAAALLVLGALALMPAQAAYFGAGTLLLIAGLIACSRWLRGTPFHLHPHPGASSLARLGARNAAWRPGRSVTSIALIAAAAFLLVSLESFRLDGSSPAGPWSLLAESRIPIFDDPDPKPNWLKFRLKPGDDVSCLNLYQPRNPRIVGAPSEFLEASGIRALLKPPSADGAVPAAVDPNSLLYVLHKKLGDEVVIQREGAPPVRLQLVAELRNSVFQSELIVSEHNFIKLFPEQEGYRVFLIEGSVSDAARLEDELSGYGFDAVSTRERLAAYHRVENTYLSTFQALGGLGLLLGTVGLAAILFRNALERRREFALLRAVGYGRGQVEWMLLAETLLLLAGGLALGTICAALAVLPALLARGGAIPWSGIAALIAAILVSGIAASLLAVRAATRTPLLEALRTE